MKQADKELNEVKRKIRLLIQHKKASTYALTKLILALSNLEDIGSSTDFNDSVWSKDNE